MVVVRLGQSGYARGRSRIEGYCTCFVKVSFASVRASSETLCRGLGRVHRPVTPLGDGNVFYLLFRICLIVVLLQFLRMVVQLIYAPEPHAPLKLWMIQGFASSLRAGTQRSEFGSSARYLIPTIPHPPKEGWNQACKV